MVQYFCLLSDRIKSRIEQRNLTICAFELYLPIHMCDFKQLHDWRVHSINRPYKNSNCWYFNNKYSDRFNNIRLHDK